MPCATCTHQSVHFLSLSYKSSGASFRWLGLTPSGVSRKMRVSCPPGSPWCPDDGRRHFRILGGGVAAVFHLLLPLAHRCVLEAGSLSRGKGRYRHPEERSEEHTSELQSLTNLVCRLLLEQKK